jgi:hypothetical protein
MRRLVLGAALALGACALAWGQGATREARIAAWLAKTDWPNGREMMRVLRDDLPVMFLAGVGTGAKLGPAWTPGNPYFETARAAVAESIRAEESRGQPVMQVDAASMARALEKSSLADEDVEFLDRLADTTLGRVTIEFFDHLMVAGAIEKIAAHPQMPAQTRERLLGLRTRLRDRIGPVMVRFAKAREEQKADAATLEAVMARAGLTRELGAQAGKELFEAPMQRLAGVIVIDTMSTITGQIEAFRASQATR